MTWIALPSGLESPQFREEGHELRAGVAPCRLAEDLAALGVQRGVERKSAVAKVLKAVRLGPSWGKRQHRIETVQSLGWRSSHRRRRRRRAAEGAGISR